MDGEEANGLVAYADLVASVDDLRVSDCVAALRVVHQAVYSRDPCDLCAARYVCVGSDGDQWMRVWQVEGTAPQRRLRVVE